MTKKQIYTFLRKNPAARIFVLVDLGSHAAILEITRQAFYSTFRHLDNQFLANAYVSDSDIVLG